MKHKLLLIKILVGVTYLGMVVVNALANILPINGVTSAQVSDSYPNLFAPAGVTFSIWGLIYLLLAGYTLYQFGLFQSDRGKSKTALFEKIGIYFSITSLANMLWIFSWHYNIIGLSVVLMLVILFFLIKIVTLLSQQKFSLHDTLLIKTPFAVYFGWITVATIANITVFLVSLGWNGFGISEQIWMTLILLVGATIGIARTLKDKSVTYGLVLVWAYVGILIKHTSADGFNGQYVGVINTAAICVVLFLVANGLVLFQRGK